MSPEAQRIAIAEACGWTHIHVDNETLEGFPVLCGINPKIGVEQSVPDYLNDLNAMNAVEQWLIGQDKPFMSGPQPSDQYEYWLCLVVLERSQWENGCWKGERKDTLKVAMAIATQRAEAFLRTIGKWKD